jgi:hypothetical protein
MDNKTRHICSLLFLFLFCLPSLVTLEHHHKCLLHESNREKHYPFLENNCPVCNFEYSNFISAAGNITEQKLIFSDSWYNQYVSRFCCDQWQSASSLRGPPDKRIEV